RGEWSRGPWESGVAVVCAGLQADRVRVRPMAITSQAVLRGVVPQALATGAGAASRGAIGTCVSGGRRRATLQGVVLVPIFVFWVLTVMRRKPREEEVSCDQRMTEKRQAARGQRVSIPLARPWLREGLRGRRGLDAGPGR
ncbi:hypothetical protein EWW49_34680, partial [Pseudomonas syringae]